MGAPEGPIEPRASLERALRLPRAEQPEAVRAWARGVSATEGSHPEAWNTAFGEGSLFDAWTRTRLLQGLYAANAASLSVALRSAAARHGRWVAIEIGVGDGRLWEQALARLDAPGTLVAIDPREQALTALRARLERAPVEVVAWHAPVEAVLDDLAATPADQAVCSLTLHHVAGWDARERRAHGLTGPGKREVLEAVVAALAPRGGQLVLNEADIHCDLELAPGEPLLTERLLDSYVRRCARAVLTDAFGWGPVDPHTRRPAGARADADDDLRRRWLHIAVHWCADQLGVAAKPVAERDVYELDVPRWRRLLREAGLTRLTVRCTDDWNLFHRYEAGLG